MKKIGIVVNNDKDIDYKYTGTVIEKLLDNGFEAIVEPQTADVIRHTVKVSSNIYRDADFIICVGGDGTFLKTARQAFFQNKPVLGINKGTVGFLAEVEPKDIERAIKRLSEGNFQIQSRMILDIKVIRQGEIVFEDIAINDAVVTRVALSRILRLKVSMDDKFMDSFPGDGIIISTPTGSTGYSLSAGGPIVQPDMRIMVISPICPHTLYSRSFIASDSRMVQISIEDNGETNAMVTVDGQQGFNLEPGDLVCAKASNNDAKFASVSNVNFYDVLRAKIHKTD